jgi:hypothetical protein
VASNLHYVARSGFSFRVEDTTELHTIVFALEGTEWVVPPGEAVDIGEAILSFARVCSNLDKLKRKGMLAEQRRERAGKRATDTAG